MPLRLRHPAELPAYQADLVVRSLAESMRRRLLEAHECRSCGVKVSGGEMGSMVGGPNTNG